MPSGWSSTMARWLLLVLWAIIPVHAAPATRIFSNAKENVIGPVIAEECLGCNLDWLTPIEEPLERLSEARREETNNGGQGEWVEMLSDGAVEDSNKPLTGKLLKKDVFASRGWGAGGMPFSVLYMPPSTRPQAQGNVQAEPRKNQRVRVVQGPAPPMKPTNYRLSVRNGSLGPSRRQYSIIPQLFVSYGWGPLGK